MTRQRRETIEKMVGQDDGSVRLRMIPDGAQGRGALFDPGDELPADTPILIGPGDLDQTCGHCGRVLIRGLQLGQVSAIVLRCPSCRAYNETNPAPPKRARHA